MPFADYEDSIESGRPVELYVFSYPGGTFRYTTAQHDIESDARVYSAMPGLSRSSIQDTGEIEKSRLQLTAPPDFPVARLFEVYPPSDVVDLIVSRAHMDDLEDTRIIWLGRVLNVEWAVGRSELTCESLYTQLRQPGLRRAYSRNCPHILYGAACGVLSISEQIALAVTAISTDGFELTCTPADSYANGFFAGGKIEWERSSGLFERRGIKQHLGQVLTLTHPIESLPGDAALVAYPGCDKTTATCSTRFSNLDNFGGFPNMTSKNPFGQSSIY